MTDVRHGIASSGIDASLILNPQPVEPVKYSEDRPGEPGFWGWIDFHALYPIAMDYLVRSASDLKNHTSFCPHVTLSVRLCLLPGEPGFYRHLQRLTFDYFVYKQEFQHVLDGYQGTMPDGVGRYLDYRLAWVIEGGLTYCAGSWYFQPVVLGGKEYTYARYFTVNCVQDFPGIVKFAMRTFPGIETPTTMNSFYRYAKTLRDAEGTDASK